MSKNKKKRKPAPISYKKRTYRRLVDPAGLTPFEVRVQETDLHILAVADLQKQATHLVRQYRNQLENHITRNPQFLDSLVPLEPEPLAPPIVKAMLAAGQAAGVGPMAAVAGAMAHFVGQDLMAEASPEIMVENGGDIFLNRKNGCTVAIFAGRSPLSNKVGLKLAPDQMPTGICTSSASIGHSLSLGRADAVTVVARQTSVADAAATRLGNETGHKDGMQHALALAPQIPGILGVVIIQGEDLGAWGEVELVGV